jgi:dUTP pyrophosphatase
MKFKKLTTTAITPTRGSPNSAGLDLYADADVLVSSGASVMLGTGIAIEIPQGHVGLVAIRSSVGKAGVALANSVGVIDSDYRGELKLCLTYTAGSGGHYIRKGQAIAQLIVTPYHHVELVEVDALSTTDRGAGGFGSTGK